jgi:DNA (cytosine-5)-methyltransferase 1
MKHLDLFSGIGGFALAASWVWPDHEVVAFCDNEPFCQKVLNKHWPDVPVVDDIRKIKGEDYGAVDIITGGFPCQPFSCAGKRGGEADDRYLWPEMLRVIREIRPTWVIGENVAGIINMALDQVCSDLEDADYAVQPFIIPACAVNAPHRRDRVWIVANRQRQGRIGRGGQCGTDRSGVAQNEQTGQAPRGAVARCDERVERHAPDTQRVSGRPGLRQNGQEQDGDQSANCGGDAPDTCHQRSQGGEWPGSHEQRQAVHGSVAQRNNAWNEPWIKAATRLCSVDDGLPGGLVRPRGWRVNALKAAGNAIVPQVVAVIMQAIRELDDRFCKKTNVKDC